MTASYKVEQHVVGGGWICYFKVGGKADRDAYGTDGTGLKIYGDKAKAEAAGKRYLKKMKQNGFEVE